MKEVKCELTMKAQLRHGMVKYGVSPSTSCPLIVERYLTKI